MPAKPSSADLQRISRIILNSVVHLFSEPEFDEDAGDIRLLDRDESCVWLGLFPTDEEGEAISDKPVAVWTIAVSHEPQTQQGDVQ